ncbi:Hsp20/alpha crystallin family protein, partial [Thermodesulfobacteriota bacterium]
ERRRGYFSRVVELPCKVMMDDVEARYKNGVLNIIMPKCADETCKVKIEVG